MNFATFTDDTKYETNNTAAATTTTITNKSEDIFLNEILKPTENIQQQTIPTNLVSDLEGLLIGSTNIETNVNKKIDKNSILALYGQTKNINSPTANSFQQNNSNNILGMNQQQQQHQQNHFQIQQQQLQQQQTNRLFQLNLNQNKLNNQQQVLKPSESNVKEFNFIILR